MNLYNALKVADDESVKLLEMVESQDPIIRKGFRAVGYARLVD